MGHWTISKGEMDLVEPKVKAWLGQILIVNTTPEEDRELNVDLACLGGDISWHGRWRYSDEGHDNFASFFREFTTRSWRPKWPDEEAKIRAGLGDWFFYCWVDNETKQILCGTLLDLKRLSACIDELPSTCEQENRDASKGGADSRWKARWIKHAAERGCLVDFRFAEESELLGGVAFPMSKWGRKQFMDVLRPYLPDLPALAARRVRRI